MRIYDISQELFSCNVFPGDMPPAKEQVLKISEGAACNLTNLSMCAHNGTHIDAPYHFYEEGRTVDELDLRKVIGTAQVIAFDGELRGTDVDRLLKEKIRRVLFKGKTIISLESARALNRHGVYLVGVEAQTVGVAEAPRGVHLELLRQEVALLEGVCLSEVPEGIFFLCAAPLNLGGADGAPCRAVLIEQ